MRNLPLGSWIPPLAQFFLWVLASMDIECVADGQGVESAFATTSPASVQGEDPSSTYSRFWMDVGEKLDNVG